MKRAETILLSYNILCLQNSEIKKKLFPENLFSKKQLLFSEYFEVFFCFELNNLIEVFQPI